MSVSPISTSSYQTVGGLLFPAASSAVTSNSGDTTTADSTSTAVTGNSNNSSLSSAITQSLAQYNANLDLSSLLSATGQQSSSDFLSNLYSALPGLSGSSQNSNALSGLLNGGSAPAAVQLDQNSATIKLQTSIQQLISNLDSSNGSNTETDFGNLQQSFNNLIQNSGGNPDQTSLQSFLQLVATNIQGSSTVGSLFSTSA
ncbi:hypothetical protein [Undibacterium griseum]|uniref:Uncharacterized protein n=1 Tax=Undibacterium griseum TaxID=2762295 RepID=A0ABR6YIU4_9BURK|nr:hypothetical protein [Undibacterium griseum]MBC3883784.1 hypothetical protein [Undibacterium griseum]